MQDSNAPLKIPAIWANSAGGSYITYPVPTPSQIGITNGAASFTDGFPPNCFIPYASGGAGPFGKDFNGLLKQVTAGQQWLQTGALFKYDSTFQSDIAGYPKGAMLQSSSNPGYAWVSTADNNLTDPDTGGAGWVLLQLGGTGFVFNTTEFSTSTRVTMSGTSGNSYTVTPWSPGTFTKQSATSTLLIISTAPTFSGGAYGPAQATLDVGGTNKIFVPANNTSSNAVGEATLVQTLSGLGAGSLALTLSFSRNDSNAWTGTFCFNSTDNSIYPSSTQAVLVIAEIGP
jgi:hypothetical protein